MPVSGRPRIPSPLSAALVWVGSLGAVLLASIGFVALALRSVAASKPAGVTPTTASALLENPSWFIAVAVATQLTVALVLAGAIALTRVDRRIVLPFVRAPQAAFMGALLVVFGLAPLAQVVGELTSRLLHVELTASRLVSHVAQGASVAEYVALVLCLSLLPGLIEEGMFRGYITAAFSHRSFATRLLVPSLLFGVFHLEPTQAAATIVLGVGFALARLYSGSLFPGMVAHAVYNGTVIAIARFASNIEDHTIRPLPVLIGSALFVAGVLSLRSAGSARAESAR